VIPSFVAILHRVSFCCITFLNENYKMIFNIAPSQPVYEETPKNPCSPQHNPCGPFSECRQDYNNLAICTCLPGYLGSSPNCHPECTINSDCSNDKACINQKCKNPCDGVCGFGADCKVQNHNAICVCPEGTQGDSFKSCTPIPTPSKKFIVFPLSRSSSIWF
jgi:hypothetical protein